MSNCAQDGEQDEQGSGGNISPAQERILTPDPRYCRYDDRLGALVRLDGEVYQKMRIVV
jgi:hypothetical protein